MSALSIGCRFAAVHVSEMGERLASSWVLRKERERGVALLLAELKECISARDLGRGRKVHQESIDRGLFAGSVLQSSVINMYGKCGSMVDAQKVFDSLDRPNVVCRNCLLQGYVDNEDWELALKLFDGVPEKNSRTYVIALAACAALAGGEDHKWLEKGKSIHSSAVENDCCDNIFVESTLVHMYAKAGSMVEARSVFDAMSQRNVVSWNALLQGYVDNGQSEVALQLFDEMERGGGCLPGARTFVAAFTACATLATGTSWSRKKVLEKGLVIHAKAVKRRCCDNVFVQNSLMDMYGKCGSMNDARRVFDGMIQRSAVSWTTLLRGYIENGQSELALELFENMESRPGGCAPNARTYIVALSACADLVDKAGDERSKHKWLEKGKAAHSRAVLDKCSDNLFVQNTLVDLYSRSGEISLARSLFDEMKTRDIVSWNALLHGYVACGQADSALDLFHELISENSGCTADARTFVSVISACAAAADNAGQEALIQRLEQGKTLHALVIRSLNTCDSYVDAALINMYSKCRSMGGAQRLFDAMAQHCAVCWNSLVQGYVDGGASEMALETVAAMEEDGNVSPDCRTYAAALMACGNLMAVEIGKKIHEQIKSSGLETDVLLATCLVDFYGKCGNMVAAREVFDGMLVRDMWVWNTLMCGYSEQGETEKVFEVFEKMRKQGVAPNEITFTHLLAACSHGGLTSKGRECFEMMQKKFGIAPNVIHFNCLIDLLGRGNKLDEALKVVREMPHEANSVSWMALLSACRKWNNVEIGRVAHEELVKLDEQNSAGYVLMANIYGSSKDECTF